MNYAYGKQYNKYISMNLQVTRLENTLENLQNRQQ